MEINVKILSLTHSADAFTGVVEFIYPKSPEYDKITDPKEREKVKAEYEQVCFNLQRIHTGYAIVKQIVDSSEIKETV